MKKTSNFSNIELFYSKKFSKNDHLFKNYLIKKVILTNKKNFKISETSLIKIINLPHGEDFSTFIKKFFSKYISVEYINTSKKNKELHFNIIASYWKDDNIYHLNLTEDFYDLFTSENSQLRSLNIDSLLSFSNVVSSNLFSFVKSNQMLSSITVSLDELKNILGIEDNYNRFFDFENKILIPALKEIRSNISFPVSYSKLKNSLSSNSKVTKIKFEFLKSNSTEDVSTLLELVGSYSQNSNILKSFVEKSINQYDYKYVERNIKYSILHNKNNFEEFLTQALKHNYVSTRFKDNSIEYKKKYTLLSSSSKSFATLKEFREYIFNEIKKQKLTDIALMVNILKMSFNVFNQLYKSITISKNEIYNIFYNNLEKNNECIYDNGKVIIIAEYNDLSSESHVSIFSYSHFNS